jgi:filamentous hemagglutinin
MNLFNAYRNQGKKEDTQDLIDRDGVRGLIRGLSAIVGVMWLMVCGMVVAQGVPIVADDTKVNRIGVSGNGDDAWLVNVNAPNERGLSVNYFNEFNVRSNGVVLNNAAKAALLQQLTVGGSRQVSANPNYAGLSQGAKVILNQVTSSKRSVLEGYLEVAGDRAAVVIANPNGITCDGCGFVNVNRVGLVGGTAELDNAGNLSGYRVSGDVQVGRGGMEVMEADYASVIGTAVQLQGVIVGNKSTTVEVVATGNKGKLNQADIDIAELGGVYSGVVKLKATGNGVGVKVNENTGRVEEDIKIGNDGKVLIRGGNREDEEGNSGGLISTGGGIDVKAGTVEILDDGFVVGTTATDDLVRN